jgi:hypothetical protein
MDARIFLKSCCPPSVHCVRRRLYYRRRRTISHLGQDFWLIACANSLAPNLETRIQQQNVAEVAHKFSAYVAALKLPRLSNGAL